MNAEYSLERLMLKLMLQYFVHLMWRADLLENTFLDKKGAAVDEMVEWHH